MTRKSAWSSQAGQVTMIEIIRDNPATFGLIAVILAVFIIDFISCLFLSTCRVLMILFAQVNQLVWEGEAWRLFTAMFVHADIIHLLSNVLFLLIYGLRLEELKGSRWVLLTFILSGFAGNVLSLIIMRPDIISLGASGAVFGLLGALLVLLAKKYPSQAKSMIFLAIIFFIITISVNTNVFAHFGGLITGAFIMFIDFQRQERYRRTKRILP